MHPTRVESRRLDVRGVLALAVVAAIWTIVLALHATLHRPAVAVAGAFDLTVTAGVAAYFLAVRGGHLPRWLLGAIVAAGAACAKVLLAGTGGATHAALAAGAALELAALAVIVVRLGRARRAWRTLRARGTWWIEALDGALAATGLPARVAAGIASELAVVAAGLGLWRAARPAPGLYTVHRRSGWALYAGVLVAMSVVETVLVHVALAASGHAQLAWLLSALSLYGALWLVGDLHALRHGGVVVTADTVELRLGVRWRGTIARAAILRVERGAAPAGALRAGILGANVVLHLATPCTLHGLLGRRRTGRMLALSIDEPERFCAAVTSSA